jgi:phage repressor protein C with HTH and peptisase S24 domain
MAKLTLGEKIRQIRKGLGLNQAAFAKELGFKFPTAVSKYEDNTRIPDKDRLLQIAKLGKISLDELLDHNPLDKKNKLTPVQPDFPANDFVLIRQVNGKISAGNGFLPDDSVDIQAAFRKDWIKRKGGKPDRMSLIKVDGDSMEPTLLSGDLVLVDHSRDTIASQGGIYAIAIDDEIMIKRVQPVFPDGKLRVISDNKQYDPFEIETGRVRVNGKVIWFAREMER